MKEWAALPLRIAVGVVFVAHGLQKAFGLFGGPGIRDFSSMIANLGFTPEATFAYIVAYIELIGGLFLIVGFLTRISASLILLVMAVAVFKVHFVKGFFLSNGGFEYPFVLLLACLSLAFSGPGKFSITKKL